MEREMPRKTDKCASRLIPTRDPECSGLEWTAQHGLEYAERSGVGYLRQYSAIDDDYTYRKFEKVKDLHERLKEIRNGV